MKKLTTKRKIVYAVIWYIVISAAIVVGSKAYLLVKNPVNVNTIPPQIVVPHKEPNASTTPKVEEKEKPLSLKASVTAYSEIDSCHTGKSCLMASGKRAYVGAVACPRNIKLGTKVIINGVTYTCEDRTATWVDGRFDIFMGYGQEAYNKAISFGVKNLIIQL